LHVFDVSAGIHEIRLAGGALRKFAGTRIHPDREGMVVRWALMELTGESLPEPRRPTLPDTAIWFLESLDDQ
jgi:hypothetical protein